MAHGNAESRSLGIDNHRMAPRQKSSKSVCRVKRSKDKIYNYFHPNPPTCMCVAHHINLSRCPTQCRLAITPPHVPSEPHSSCGPPFVLARQSS
jgi:hypothetical protein